MTSVNFTAVLLLCSGPDEIALRGPAEKAIWGSRKTTTARYGSWWEYVQHERRAYCVHQNG